MARWHRFSAEAFQCLNFHQTSWPAHFVFLAVIWLNIELLFPLMKCRHPFQRYIVFGDIEGSSRMRLIVRGIRMSFCLLTADSSVWQSQKCRYTVRVLRAPE